MLKKLWRRIYGRPWGRLEKWTIRWFLVTCRQRIDHWTGEDERRFKRHYDAYVADAAKRIADDIDRRGVEIYKQVMDEKGRRSSTD